MTTVTIDFLPVEIIDLVLKEAYLLERTAVFRYAFVCSKWTGSSLNCLYSWLTIKSQDQAKALAKGTGLGQYRTKRIDIGKMFWIRVISFIGVRRLRR